MLMLLLYMDHYNLLNLFSYNIIVLIIKKYIIMALINVTYCHLFNGNILIAFK
jgi:hypothetical protein